ncbi:uncharacterized protein LOC119547323 isoform X1 [Drosophila subpulchrella]|uniref:uncharacterized protein LOC119547323 isoform X1 n=1 Tax=Drosophila subpulchrella TaxID=1486046 RepID=UPI0018A17858|nr:uncharacterized protein LOC119547323 isoform X1 [Drosophila subpulchrella]
MSSHSLKWPKNREKQKRQVKFQMVGDSVDNIGNHQEAHRTQSHGPDQIGDGLVAKISSVSEPRDQPCHKASPLKGDEKEFEDYRQLHKVFQKLDMADQIVLYRSYHLLPAACISLWRTTRKRLDFRTLYKELGVEDQNHLLIHMMVHFKYVYFVADRLQENLNTLERAGVKSLNSVQRCELLVMDEKSRLEGKTLDHSAGGDSSGAKGMAQWPLHALPKLMRNVRRFKAHCEIQVHFVEHFKDLELLVLYGSISQSALTGILERCEKLTRLFLKFDCVNLSLKSIEKCSKLRDLSLPTRLFARQKDLVMKLTDLRLLELTHCQNDSQLTLECLECVLGQRPESVDLIQMECKGLKDPIWIKQVGLDRCSQIRGLVLSNCHFCDREICQLSFPKVQKYIALSSCHDIKEYQILDMVRQCPGLNELYLIDCPQLSWKVLQGIYRIRKSENLSYPITIVLGQCTELQDVYQTMYPNYWCFKLPYLKIERVQKQSRPVQDIQVFFNINQLDST